MCAGTGIVKINPRMVAGPDLNLRPSGYEPNEKEAILVESEEEPDLVMSAA